MCGACLLSVLVNLAVGKGFAVILWRLRILWREAGYAQAHILVEANFAGRKELAQVVAWRLIYSNQKGRCEV